jgi:hypothetical protein
MRVKKYRRAIALFLAIGLMVLIPSGMGVSASGNTVEAKMSENIAQVLSMTGIEREEYSDQQVIDVDGQRVRQLVFDDNLKVDMDGANVKAISHFTACTNDAIVVYGEDDISETVNNIVEISDMDENYDLVGSEEFDDDYWRLTWVKSYGSIQNPYESVNAVVNRRTRELTTYRRFDEAPNTITPGITQSDAFERLTQLDTVEGLNLSNAECELTFTKRNSQSRAFLGWSDTVEGGNSTDFSSAFFPEVIAGNHSNNIRDAAVWAADQVPGYHTAPIKFIGDRTYRGFV